MSRTAQVLPYGQMPNAVVAVNGPHVAPLQFGMPASRLHTCLHEPEPPLLKHTAPRAQLPCAAPHTAPTARVPVGRQNVPLVVG